MKFLRSTILMAVAVASASVAVTQAHVPGARIAVEAGLLMESEEAADTPATYFLRRDLQAGSGPGTTAPPPTTTAPPTTAPPTTAPPPPPTTPPPTTAPPTTAPPTTTPPPTETTAAPGPTTEPPATTTPAPTDKKDENDSNVTKTPVPTTAGPSTSKPPSTSSSMASAGSDASEGSNATPPAGTNKLTDNSNAGGAKTEASKDSKMSTGTIIGIVGGIVVGVGILAVIAVVLARKRREDDDDPLSPFELSMDKGYNGAGAGASAYGGQQMHQNQNQNQNQYGNGSANAYGASRTGATNNAAAIGGAAAVGAGAGVGAGMMMTTDTPAAGANAAGVAYTQFYDPVTSPNSMYHQEQTQQQHTYASGDLTSTRTDPSNNASNLWMSAMEPKENDVEGAGTSVPPEVSLPQDLANNSSFVSRNSYDELPGSSIDIDQSSVLSGGSDLEKDFPDYEDDSSRGSYEL